MSRRLVTVIFGLVLLGLGGCDELDYPASQTVLWQLERNGQTAWLFGTIHTPHARFQPLPEEVLQALRRSQHFFGEMELTEAEQMAMFRAMRLPQGQSLYAQVGAARFDRMLTLGTKLGTPMTVQYLDGMRIWAMALIFSQPRVATSPPLDLLLYETARQGGCQTEGLESAAEQAAIFDELDEPLQLAMLDEAMASAAAGYPEYQRLLTAYLDHDVDTLIREATASLDGSLPADSHHQFLEALIPKRNHRFRERLRPAMERGEKCFVAVGAAHLFGSEGLLAIFVQEGFEVTPVPFRFVPAPVSPVTLIPQLSK